jgi:hypothetical protein
MAQRAKNCIHINKIISKVPKAGDECPKSRQK